MLEVSNSRLGVALVSLFVGAALMSLREFGCPSPRLLTGILMHLVIFYSRSMGLENTCVLYTFKRAEKARSVTLVLLTCMYLIFDFLVHSSLSKVSRYTSTRSVVV